jgi:hypothetical protein
MPFFAILVSALVILICKGIHGARKTNKIGSLLEKTRQYARGKEAEAFTRTIRLFGFAVTVVI